MTTFAQEWWDFNSNKSGWEDKFLDLLSGDQEFDDFATDSYDSSITIINASNNWRLSINQQKYLYDSGFIRIYVKHSDGWDTHYRILPNGSMSKGWRRKYYPVSPNSDTSGYFEISYWPEDWKQTHWLETGYMRIVPDPLDN